MELVDALSRPLEQHGAVNEWGMEVRLTGPQCI